MTNDEVIKGFYNHLQEIEGGLKNLKYKLGDEYQDAIQDALIRLYRHNDKNGIDGNNLKNLCFITLKNCCITLVNRNKTKFNHDELNDNFDMIDEKKDNELDDYDKKLRSQLLQHISKDEYKELIKYYDFIYTPFITKELQDSAKQIKTRLGHKKKYVITMLDGKEHKFSYLKQMAEFLGCDYTYLTTSYREFGEFKYHGDVYKIRIEASILKIPRKKQNKLK